MRTPLVPLILLFTGLTALAQVGSVSGVIHDEQGAALPGARVTLDAEGNSPPPLSMTSDEQGRYRFGPVPAGAYHLEVSLDGFATRQSATVTVSAAGPVATMNVAMAHRAESASRPQFQAAGVRGLIDPGGYSAPANAAAASGLIKGVADLKRTDNRAGVTVNASCSLEPGLQKAVADQPQNAQAILRLGEFYLAHGQMAKAIPTLQRAHVLSPRDPETFVQLARAYLQAEQFEAAKTLLVKEAERTSETNGLLARANEGLGKFSEAAEDYRRAADQQASEENLFGVGYEYILAGSPKAAAAAFAEGAQRFPQSMQLLIGLGSTQFLEGRTAESIQTLLRAVALDPSDPRPYPGLSQASSISSEEARRVHSAFENYANVAVKDPRSSYYLALNLLHDPAADDARIEQLLQRGIVLDPDLADAHYQLGVLYARRGDYQHAARELTITVRLSPDRREAHYRLAIAYRQIGEQGLSAKEMQLFHDAQEPKAGVSLDQYISVLEPPAERRPCPGDAP